MSDEDRFSNPTEARKRAMDYLARREHGRDELLQKLEKAGFDPELVADVVATLQAEGLQSNERFAEAFVQSRIDQGKGPVRIRAELRERGLDDSAIELAIEAAEADWYRLAHEVKARKFGTGLPADFGAKARQMRFLQYRGFESAHIQAAVSGDTD